MPTAAPTPPAPEPAPEPTRAPADPDTTDDDGAVAPAPSEASGTRTFELSLNGDGTGDCSWGVDEDEFFYEIRYPPGYTVTGNPVTLVDPDGQVIVSEGGGMRVTGRLAPEETPRCDVGTVLIADSVEPL
ncbi:MAG TPA: hypothetical protein VIK95_01395 [Egibacteraceae bacterium]